LEPRAAIEVTFSAAKSVSVLYALGDEELRRRIVAAHDAAISETISWIEEHVAASRQGRGGVERAAVGGVLAASYLHRTSRPVTDATGGVLVDPQLHSHVLVANMAPRVADGAWRALDGRAWLGTQTRGMRAIYDAALRRELAVEVGVRWERTSRGGFEIVGVPEALVEVFSSRRGQILAAAEAHGTTTSRAGDVIAVATRERKSTTPAQELDEQIRLRAHAVGFAPDAVVARVAANVGADRVEVARRIRAEEARLVGFSATLAGPEGLTRQQTTFTRADVLLALADELAHGAHAQALTAAADRFLERGAIEVSDPGAAVARYTTASLLDVERRVLVLAAAVVRCPVGAEHVDGAVATSLLGDDQATAIQALLAHDGHRVRLLEAGAGRGKTHTIGVLAEACRRGGVPVIGCAWTGVAADLMVEDAAISAVTIARLLRRLEDGSTTLPEVGVLVIDEASQIPTRALAALLEHAAPQPALVVVLVGDRRQLPSIDAGGAFASLADRIGAVELVTNRRQRDPLDRQVEALLAAGEAPAAVALLDNAGRIHEHPTTTTALRAMVDDWVEAGGAREPGRVLLVAHDRVDVALLNDACHQHRQQQGLVASEDHRLRVGVRVSVGDRVRLRRNDAALDVRNGMLGTLTTITATSAMVALENGRLVELPDAYAARYLELGYATTGHLAQGQTVDRAIVLAQPDRGGAEWAYVATTRHRDHLTLHLPTSTSDDAREALTDALATSWRRVHQQVLAHDQLTHRYAVLSRRLEDAELAATSARQRVTDAIESLRDARPRRHQDDEQRSRDLETRIHACDYAHDRAHRQLDRLEQAAAQPGRRVLQALTARPEPGLLLARAACQKLDVERAALRIEQDTLRAEIAAHRDTTRERFQAYTGTLAPLRERATAAEAHRDHLADLLDHTHDALDIHRVGVGLTPGRRSVERDTGIGIGL
jgi:conjugative relaxase-like TrwC/TraI family protein